jgi:hypothetical protein
MYDIVISGGTILGRAAAPGCTGDMDIKGERNVAVGGKSGPARRARAGR